MRTLLYYYTATGNSLALARGIARGLGEAELRPIAEFRTGSFKPEAERVGIFFPIYAWGPPRTVEDFLRALDPSGLSYVFALASCGGTAANTLPGIKKAFRAKGGDLHAGFVVSSQGYVDVDPASGENGMINMVRKLSGTRPRSDVERLPEILEAVRASKASRPEHADFGGAVLGGFFHRMASPQFAKMDAGYRVSEACDGCGICTRVCPRQNVVLEGDSPIWRHDCDNCGSCSTWCPKRAIFMVGGVQPGGRHHPEVALKDMLLR